MGSASALLSLHVHDPHVYLRDGLELRLAGLKLDDVRNEWHPDVQTALSRLSPEELSNRNKRLKRAMDLSLKHSELNKEAQASVEPLVGYLPLDRAREERLERCLLLEFLYYALLGRWDCLAALCDTTLAMSMSPGRRGQILWCTERVHTAAYTDVDFRRWRSAARQNVYTHT